MRKQTLPPRPPPHNLVVPSQRSVMKTLTPFGPLAAVVSYLPMQATVAARMTAASTTARGGIRYITSTNAEFEPGIVVGTGVAQYPGTLGQRHVPAT